MYEKTRCGVSGENCFICTPYILANGSKMLDADYVVQMVVLTSDL